MLRQLGRTYNTRELRYELESFRHYHPPRGFLRRDLKVRVSGRRLLKIASRLFGIEAARKARNLKIGTSPSGNIPQSLTSGNTTQTPADTVIIGSSQKTDESTLQQNPSS